MVRVIEFITSMGEGGAQSLVKDYALSLNQEEFEVRIFCVFPLLDSGPGKQLLQHGIHVKSVYPKYCLLWRIINKVIGRYAVSRKLRKELKIYKPQVLHAHLGVLHYLLSVKDVLPRLFYTCHSVPMRTFGSTNSPEFKAAQELIRTSNMHMIALHKEMKEELDKLFGVDNTSIIYNGIDVKRFEVIDGTKETIRRSLNIEENAFLIGHVGRFITEKNHKFVVKVFSEVNRLRPESRLLLIGTGPLKNSIEKMIKDCGQEENVILLDNRSDIPYLLKAMDVFLFPSIKEGLPISLVEAQASGIYCVASTNITNEIFFSPNLITLNLDSSIDLWVKAVLFYKKKPDTIIVPCMFNMKDSINRLELLYKK